MVPQVEAESGRSVTCSEFLLHSIRIAEAMKDIGFQPGDCAALIGKNGIDIFAAAAACLFSGGKMSPVDNYSKARKSDSFQMLSKSTRDPRLMSFLRSDIVESRISHP